MNSEPQGADLWRLRHLQGLPATKGKSLTVNVSMMGKAGKSERAQRWRFLGSSSCSEQPAQRLAGPLRRAFEEKQAEPTEETPHVKVGNSYHERDNNHSFAHTALLRSPISIEMNQTGLSWVDRGEAAPWVHWKSVDREPGGHPASLEPEGHSAGLHLGRRMSGHCEEMLLKRSLPGTVLGPWSLMTLIKSQLLSFLATYP